MHLALLLSLSAWAQNPPNTAIQEAIIVDVTTEGLGSIETIVSDLIPASVEVPDYYNYYCDEVCVIWCFCAYEYEVDMRNGWAGIQIDKMDLIPGAGNTLTLDGSATIQINTPADPLYFAGSGGVIGITLGDECDVWVDPFTIDLSTSFTAVLASDPITGATIIDFGANPIEWSWNLTEDDVKLSGCTLGDINDILDFFGLNLVGLLMDQLEPQIDAILTTLPADLEATLDEAVPPLDFVDTIDLLGVPLTYDIRPSDLIIDSGGVRLVVAGRVDAPQADCVADYGVTGSKATPSTAPPIGSQPTGLAFDTHASALVDDDFANQALFAVWNAGLLCFELEDDSGLDLPLPIDTGLLGLFAPGVFDLLFRDKVPLAIVTEPRLPPEITIGEGHDLGVLVEDLGLGFYAELDGRRSRILDITLDGEIGADLVFDATTGELGTDIHIGSDAFTPRVMYNEFKPDSSPIIEDQFSSVFDLLVGPLLGSTLDGLAFPMPSFSGLGILDVDTSAAGTAGDRLGLFTTVGEVPYEAAGCAGTGTTTTTTGADTCSGGCSTSSLPSRALFTMLLPLFVVSRRRGSHRGA